MAAAGAREGDLLMAYDYSTSLPVLALSRAYAPGLRRGACEILGCSAIGMDGLPALASRTAFFYSIMRPDLLLIRSDLLAPLRAKLAGGLGAADPRLRVALVSHADVAPLPRLPDLGVPARLLCKSDRAAFLCLSGPDGCIEYPDEVYDVGCDGVLSAALRRPGGARARTSIPCRPDPSCASGLRLG